MSDAGNEIYCFEAATGQILWHETFGHAHASPVVAGGLVYFLNDKGTTHVIRPGNSYELVSSNDLGERCFASPAVSGRQFFMRGATNLFCIGTVAK